MVGNDNEQTYGMWGREYGCTFCGALRMWGYADCADWIVGDAWQGTIPNQKEVLVGGLEVEHKDLEESIAEDG